MGIRELHMIFTKIQALSRELQGRDVLRRLRGFSEVVVGSGGFRGDYRVFKRFSRGLTRSMWVFQVRFLWV